MEKIPGFAAWLVVVVALFALAFDNASLRGENALVRRIIIEDAAFMRRVADRDTVVWTPEEQQRLRAGADANDYIAHRPLVESGR